MSQPSTKPANKHKRIILITVGIAIGMFGFGFALVPIYNVMCKTLGINGKTANHAIANHAVVNKSRTITIEFVTTNNSNLPWTFRPETRKMKIHPGADNQVIFYAKNLTNQTMTVQAIPSVTPGLAAKHLKKTECFCFTRQTFKAHQALEMPVVFHIDNEIPEYIHEITLSYTLFHIPDKKKS